MKKHCSLELFLTLMQRTPPQSSYDQTNHVLKLIVRRAWQTELQAITDFVYSRGGSAALTVLCHESDVVLLRRRAVI